MVQRKLFMRALSVLMSASLCFPAMAAETTVAKVKTAQRSALELQMDASGLIRGKVVDRQGKSLPNAEVKVSNRVGSAVSKTDANGVFSVTGLSMGEYFIGVGSQSQKVRVWNAKTAPPKTAQAALLVVGGAVRGQCGPSCGGCNSCAQTCAPACNPAPACAPSCGPSCGGCNSCGGGGGYGSVFGGGGFGGGGFGGGAFGGGAAGLLSSPVLIGAGVAAAIAIPLAIDDDDDDAS